MAVADLGMPGGAEALVREVGAVDGLIANAGLPATGRITDLSGDEVARMLRVNLESPIHLTQAFLPGMIERGEGKVVLMGSLSGKAGSPRSSVYNATKFGLRGFAFGLRTDLVGTGVGVTVVAPGFVREVGMFAETGLEAPRVLGTTSPERVVDAVLEAIRRMKISLPERAWRMEPRMSEMKRSEAMSEFRRSGRNQLSREATGSLTSDGPTAPAMPSVSGVSAPRTRSWYR